MPLLALKHVLAAVDPNDPEIHALVSAATLANAAGASLHVVSVVASTQSGEQLRSDLFDRLRQAGPFQREPAAHVLVGDAARSIDSIADRVSADVIVLGKHRKGRSSAKGIGGTSLAVVTNASCPCLVVSKALELPLQNVLVPVDTSDTARGALLVGLSWASALRRTSQEGGAGATLTALHISTGDTQQVAQPTPVSVEKEIALAREAGGNWAAVTINGVTVGASDAPTGIATYVREHDPGLVVMGTRGLGLDAVGRLGSVAATTAQRIDTACLLVPPAIWMSVVEGKRR